MLRDLGLQPALDLDDGVGIVAILDHRSDALQFHRLVRELLDRFVPDLLRCLPLSFQTQNLLEN
eukprot:3854182-Rhodomonas_salina.1